MLNNKISSQHALLGAIMREFMSKVFAKNKKKSTALTTAERSRRYRALHRDEINARARIRARLIRARL